MWTVVFWIARHAGLDGRCDVRGSSWLLSEAHPFSFQSGRRGHRRVPAAREDLVIAAHGTPDVQLASIHIPRLLAKGTVIKYLHGDLPLHVVVLGLMSICPFGV